MALPTCCVYNLRVDVEFDPAKDEENQRKHGVSLGLTTEFHLGTAKIEVDDRKDYGEMRFNALGMLDHSLFSLTFTLRGEALRAISLRIANRKERRVYAEYLEETS